MTIERTSDEISLLKFAEALTLSVPTHAIERAVKHLDYLEALALIRAAFGPRDGANASLAVAKLIYKTIVIDFTFPGDD